MRLFIATALLAAEASGSPAVHIPGLGTVNGSSVIDVPGESFLGIPYAQPPVGDLRFRPAQPVKPWAPKTLSATAFGHPCYQPTSPAAWVTMSEDCLTLNIWRPAGAQGRRLPVLFWIHGGGMETGGSIVRWTDGARFAARRQVVVVSINYRLGPLGFLARDDLAQEPGAVGNGGANGVHDAIVALRWVQKHISSFGGDPGAVTLIGESAGGLSVCCLVASPLAEGLFRQAIMQSGPCIGPWGPYSYARGLETSRSDVNVSGKPLGSYSLKELRALPPYQLDQWSSHAQNDPQFPGYWVDGPGGVIPKMPIELLSERKANAARVLMGFNSKDGLIPFFPVVMQLLDVTSSNTSAALTRVMKSRWVNSHGNDPLFSSADVAAITAQYPLTGYGGDAVHAYVQSDADFNVICPTVQLGHLLSKAGVEVRMYEFAAGPTCSDRVHQLEVRGVYALPGKKDFGWASHASEIPFVFGTEEGPRPYPFTFITEHCPFSPATQNLSNTMQRLWGDFTSGKESSPEWPAYAQKTAEVLRFYRDGHTEVLPGYKGGVCEFWAGRKVITPS
eukprot:TRINITY_DN2100_c1_g1_i1.p1 TRINITY_DN2100_c1_g1~~TRINITY_DN2100_c1_g1_i1.p1  ORF type:complete len:600 (+),score=117.54 TRINITY_DN2100_c1_g1_i1:120-1802(+)